MRIVAMVLAGLTGFAVGGYLALWLAMRFGSLLGAGEAAGYIGVVLAVFAVPVAGTLAGYLAAALTRNVLKSRLPSVR